MLIDRTKLLPNEVVALYLDKMNDPIPQMRSAAQGRMMLVCPFAMTLTIQYFRLLSNKGFAKSEEALYLRQTHFPNEVFVHPLERTDFTGAYISDLNTCPTKEYIPSFSSLMLVPSITTKSRPGGLYGQMSLSATKPRK